MRHRRGAGLIACAALVGCTKTEVAGDPPDAAAVFRVGAYETAYAPDLQQDRLDAARDRDVARGIAALVEEWMLETKRWGGLDTVRIEVDRFRLPDVNARAITAQAKGNDYLGAKTSILRDGQSLAEFHVEHTIGAGDRSIAENYSADRTRENLVEAVAWSIVHELTPFAERQAIFEIGKREQIERAIELLERCGLLSYAEATKYSALGKLSLQTASGAEARRVRNAFGEPEQRCY